MILDKEIQQKLKEEKKRLLSEKQMKEQLLNAKSDWSLLEKFIQEINLQPNLHVDIHLNDGTVINMRCFDENENKIDDGSILPVFEDDAQIKIRKMNKH